MKKLVVILGPTASGKTELAVKLARLFNGEIVSVDSRQIFKAMNIGTAKSKLKRGCYKQIPHYLINALNIDQELTVTVFRKLAFKAIKKIQARGKLPFLVGGTGLYIRAITDNLDFPKGVPNKKIRKKLGAMTLRQLFRLYQKLDPQGAKLIDKYNQRRLIRAVEVCLLTKKPFWEQRKQRKPIFNALQIGIKSEQSSFAQTISKRTDQMLRSGLEKEARQLFKKYGTASVLGKTIGYLEWLPYLDQKLTVKQKRVIADEIKKHTLQYAKRQMTWFKKDSRIIWINSGNNLGKATSLVRRFILSP